MKAYEPVFPARGCTVDLFSTPPLNKSNIGGLRQDLVLLHSLDVFSTSILEIRPETREGLTVNS